MEAKNTIGLVLSQNRLETPIVTDPSLVDAQCGRSAADRDTLICF